MGEPVIAVAPTLATVADLVAPEGQELAPGFRADWRGAAVTVTAVLERTVVVEDADAERWVALKAAVLVDPDAMRWRPVYAKGRRSIRPETPDEREARRLRRTDELAAMGLGETAIRPRTAGRTCQCGAGLGARNQGRTCSACRSVCPTCRGSKSIDGRVCRPCYDAEQAS